MSWFDSIGTPQSRLQFSAPYFLMVHSAARRIKSVTLRWSLCTASGYLMSHRRKFSLPTIPAERVVGVPPGRDAENPFARLIVLKRSSMRVIPAAAGSGCESTSSGLLITGSDLGAG